MGGTYVDCEGTITYTWNYTDCEGNNHDWVYTYTIEVRLHHAGRRWLYGGLRGRGPQPTPPACNDNCGATDHPDRARMSGTYVDCEGTITYTWNYTDCEGNNHDWVYTYTIEVQDFTVPADDGSRWRVRPLAVAPSLPVVTDNCGATITPTARHGRYLRRLRRHHHLHLELHRLRRQQPRLGVHLHHRGADFTVPADDGSRWPVRPLALAPRRQVVTDNCGGTITPTGPAMGGTYVDCEGTITYTWNYTDCEGNTHDWVYTYTIEVKTSPCRPMMASTVACAAAGPAPAHRQCVTTTAVARHPDRAAMGGTYVDCEGTITYTWNYADCEGNNHDWVYTYTIERKTSPCRPRWFHGGLCGRWPLRPRPPVCN